MRNLMSRWPMQSGPNVKCQSWVCFPERRKKVYEKSPIPVWKILSLGYKFRKLRCTRVCIKTITLVCWWLFGYRVFVLSLSRFCDVFCKCLFLPVSIKLFWWCLWPWANFFGGIGSPSCWWHYLRSIVTCSVNEWRGVVRYDPSNRSIW